MHGEVTALGGAAGVGLLETVDSSGSASYTLAGNGYCAPNTPPTASLTANPASGDAPLTVTLDASGSFDPDLGDSVASYTFHFGDGSTPVTQSSPTVTHTYSKAGTYHATVTVAARVAWRARTPRRRTSPRTARRPTWPWSRAARRPASRRSR